MRDFTPRLEAQILALDRTYDRRRPAPTRRRVAIAAALAAAAAAIVALAVGLSGNGPAPAGALPALATPTVNASDIAPLLAVAGADLTHAHAIATPAGPAYLLTALGGAQDCLAVPAVDGRGHLYGQGCTTPAGAASHGLIVSEQTPAGSVLVAALPAGSPPPTVQHQDGTQTVVPIVYGVAALVTTTPATVTVTTPAGQTIHADLTGVPAGVVQPAGASPLPPAAAGAAGHGATARPPSPGPSGRKLIAVLKRTQTP